jgi:excisionase family DNA binding protein
LKTIREVCDETGISRFTLQQVAKKGVVPAKQSGSTWLIDTDSAGFKQWLEAHWQQPRVKGAKRKNLEGREVEKGKS